MRPVTVFLYLVVVVTIVVLTAAVYLTTIAPLPSADEVSTPSTRDPLLRD